MTWRLGSADIRKGHTERIQFAVAWAEVMSPFAVLELMRARVIQGYVGARVHVQAALADHQE